MEIKIDNKSVEQLVTAQIHLAVAEALSKNTPYLIERLVTETLGRKSDQYPYKPIIESITAKLIHDAAWEAAQEWLAEQKPAIKKLVHQKLSSKTTGLVASIAEQLTAKLAGGLDATVWLKGRE